MLTTLDIKNTCSNQGRRSNKKLYLIEANSQAHQLVVGCPGIHQLKPRIRHPEQMKLKCFPKHVSYVVMQNTTKNIRNIEFPKIAGQTPSLVQPWLSRMRYIPEQVNCWMKMLSSRQTCTVTCHNDCICTFILKAERQS